MKEAGKTTRSFRYDLNQILYDYTVEVTNTFKRLDVADSIPEEPQREVHNIVGDSDQNHPKEKEMQDSQVVVMSFPGGSEVKASACNAGDLGSIPGLGRSLGEGNGYPLQCSGLENPMDTVHPWRRERLPTPVFWPGESHGYSPWGREESGTAEPMSLSVTILAISA